MATATNPYASDLLLLWKKELHSFLDYLAGLSSPVAIDAADREFLVVFDEYRATERALKERVLGMLVRIGLHPDAPGYPMNASTYNFLRPRALAEVFLRIAKRDQAELGALRKTLGDPVDMEPRLLAHLVDDYLKARVDAIAKIEKLLGTAKPAEPKPAAAAPKAAEAATAAPAEAAPAGPAWHDESLALEERMKLVEGMGVFEKLFAAMAQTDCTACGYDCEGYARAIAEGEDKDLTKCAPGELETQSMLESIMGKR